MIVNDDGLAVMNFDTKAATGSLLAVEQEAKTEIANALHDAAAFMQQDRHVISSITADIRAAVSRIEAELGGHPAFTWAQTKLGNAIAHLEAFVAGTWTEPPTQMVAVDNRGIQLPTEPTS
jgi:hypothetical protein